MGAAISTAFWRLFGWKQFKIFMIGLDCAGKTTILYKLKLGKIMTTIPTIGFNVETVEFRNISFVVWDVGGGHKLKEMFRQHYKDPDGIILVVDSNDRRNAIEAGEHLNYMTSLGNYCNTVLLIMSNKQDLNNPMSDSELIEKLKLNKLEFRSWHIQPTSAVEGTGLYEGLEWLAKELNEK